MCLCIGVHACSCLRAKLTGAPEITVQGWATWHGLGESNSGPLQEQRAPSTADSSLQPLFLMAQQSRRHNVELLMEPVVLVIILYSWGVSVCFTTFICMRLNLDQLTAEPLLVYFVVAIIIRSLEEDRISLCGPVWPWTDCRCVPPHNSWLICSSPKTAKVSGDAVSE